MDRKILYFINPISGTNKKTLLQEKIITKNLEKGIFFEILFTNPEGRYPYLKNKIQKEKFTDVVICGGDGTVNQVVFALLGIKINIGIIPVGSGNGLARAAKIPLKIDKALKIIFDKRSVATDGFFINHKFSCMLCGIGFDAQIAHDFALQQKRGLATYIKQTVKNFIKAKPYKFDVTANGKTFSAEAYFISIANSNQFGNNFTIAPKASLHDGLLDIIIVKKMSKARMIWAVLKQIKSGEVKEQQERNFHKKEVLYFQTDKLIIHNPQLAPLHIDGEPAETDKKFIIEILPKAFELIMP